MTYVVTNKAMADTYAAMIAERAVLGLEPIPMDVEGYAHFSALPPYAEAQPRHAGVAL